MFFSGKVYDVLKYIAQVLLPAIGTLYYGLADIWRLPLAEEVVGTITVIDAFLGVALAIDSKKYYAMIQEAKGEEAKG